MFRGVELPQMIKCLRSIYYIILSVTNVCVAAMDFDFIADGLAKELISGSQLVQCFEVAALLDRLLKQRERTITTLTKAADSLNKHYRKSAIAKAVGATTGAGGKVITGVGAGAMVATAGTSFLASVGLALVGGATWATGSALTLGTLAVERWLCSGVVAEANSAIREDQNIAVQLREAWEVLTCMLKSFCDQFQYVMSIENIISAVWKVYQQIKDFVNQVRVDWEGFVAQATNTLPANVQNVASRAVEIIRSFITKAFDVMALDFVVLKIPGGLTLMMMGVGAVLIGLDIAVLLKNAVTLATNKEHPGAIEIKSKVELLKDERDQLQSFRRALQRCLQ